MEGILPEKDVNDFEEYFSSINTLRENADADEDELYQSYVDSSFDLSHSVLPSTSSTPQASSSADVPMEIDEPDRDIFAQNNLVPCDSSTFNYILPECELLQNGCGCAHNCVEQFSREDLLASHFGANELNYYCATHVNHLNVFTQGALNALVRRGPLTAQQGHARKERKGVRTQYQFQGLNVCQTVFQFVNGIGERKLKNVKALLLQEGVHEQIHGNVKGTARSRACPFQARQKAVTFILQFAQNNGLVLPGRLPGYRNNPDLLLLPSSMSKKYVYDKYCEVEKDDAMGLRLWYITWRAFCNNVVIQRPRSDLCVICQHAVMSMGRLAGLPEEVKRRRIEESLRHLTLVDHERCYYREVILQCREKLTAAIASRFSAPSSWDGTLHISFDYAQQILLPCDGQQVGPLYFLAGYKVGLFGIAIEPLHKFVLYVIPEASNTGKGANTVISMVHHFFENFSLGEASIVCHADNCCGQNKNRFMLQYLCWRVLRKLHRRAQLSFLLAGHTKFAPDLYFGLIKRLLSRSRVHCLKDVIRVAVQATSILRAVTVVLCGTETGETFVPTFDWAAFFKDGKTVPNISRYHHFVTSATEPGIMTYREFENSVENRTLIFPPNSFSDATLPAIIQPLGLTLDRRMYLYKKIRPYVRPRYRKVLCPKPRTKVCRKPKAKLGKRKAPKTASTKAGT